MTVNVLMIMLSSVRLLEKAVSRWTKGWSCARGSMRQLTQSILAVGVFGRQSRDKAFSKSRTDDNMIIRTFTVIGFPFNVTGFNRVVPRIALMPS